MMQEILQNRNELHLCPLSNRINRCPSCEEQLVYVMNEFCRECPKCGRMFECDDDEQFQEENRGRSSTAPPTTNVHSSRSEVYKFVAWGSREDSLGRSNLDLPIHISMVSAQLPSNKTK